MQMFVGNFTVIKFSLMLFSRTVILYYTLSCSNILLYSNHAENALECIFESRLKLVLHSKEVFEYFLYDYRLETETKLRNRLNHIR